MRSGPFCPRGPTGLAWSVSAWVREAWWRAWSETGTSRTPQGGCRELLPLRRRRTKRGGARPLSQLRHRRLSATSRSGPTPGRAELGRPTRRRGIPPDPLHLLRSGAGRAGGLADVGGRTGVVVARHLSGSVRLQQYGRRLRVADREQVCRTRAAVEHPPVPVAEVRRPRSLHRAGVRVDGSDVGAGRVVVPEGTVDVGRRAVGPEQSGGGEDRIVGVVDVAAGAVAIPGGRKELHRPTRAGRADPADPSHPGLHQVDGRQVGPGHAGASLRVAVVAEEPSRWGLRDDAALRQGGLWIADAVKGDGSVDAVPSQQCGLWMQPAHDLAAKRAG